MFRGLRCAPFAVLFLLATGTSSLVARDDKHQMVIVVNLAPNSGASGPSLAGGGKPGEKPKDKGEKEKDKKEKSETESAKWDGNKLLAVTIRYTKFKKEIIARGKAGDKDKYVVVNTDSGDRPAIFRDAPYIKTYTLPDLPVVEEEVLKHYAQWAAKKNVKGGYDLVVEALNAGMISEAVKYAEETSKFAETRKEEQLPAVADFLKSYAAIADKLNATAGDDADAKHWKGIFKTSATSTGSHYVVIGMSEGNAAGRELRLAALEKNFKAFYLWHAVHGFTLKVPDKKLVAIMTEKVSDVLKLREVLDGTPIQSDAFYSPPHNVVVLSPERMDPLGQEFTRLMQSKYQKGWDQATLLAGKPVSVGEAQSAADVAELSTLAMVEKALEQDAVTAMATREGSRQLYAVSGLLSPYVSTPMWVQNGITNLFQKPKGPAFLIEGNSRATMTTTYTHGFGTVNYVLGRHLHDMFLKKELPQESDKLLRNVVTDRYFDALASGEDADGDASKLSGTAKKVHLEMKAQSTSWALVYYLAKKRPKQLKAFYSEMNRYPRDMKIDRAAMFHSFCRALELVEKTNPNKVDETAFKQFAEEWVLEMKQKVTTNVDVSLNDDDTLRKKKSVDENPQPITTPTTR